MISSHEKFRVFGRTLRKAEAIVDCQVSVGGIQYCLRALNKNLRCDEYRMRTSVKTKKKVFQKLYKTDLAGIDYQGSELRVRSSQRHTGSFDVLRIDII